MSKVSLKLILQFVTLKLLKYEVQIYGLENFSEFVTVLKVNKQISPTNSRSQSTLKFSSKDCNLLRLIKG